MVKDLAMRWVIARYHRRVLSPTHEHFRITQTLIYACILLCILALATFVVLKVPRVGRLCYGICESVPCLYASWLRWLQQIDDKSMQAEQDALIAMPAIQYKDTLGDLEIRLIVVGRHKLKQSPIFRFLRTQLNLAPDFVACSYTWGAPLFDQFAQVSQEDGSTAHLAIGI